MPIPNQRPVRPSETGLVRQGWTGNAPHRLSFSESETIIWTRRGSETSNVRSQIPFALKVVSRRSKLGNFVALTTPGGLVLVGSSRLRTTSGFEFGFLLFNLRLLLSC